MYWLAAKMKYLQSWEDETIYFDRFLTVLEGKSNSGKSVLIKALTLGINYKEYTPKERRSIVRDYQRYPDRTASLTIVTSDYCKVKFSFTVDSVFTSLTRADGTKKNYKGTADDEVLKVLGIKQCSGSTRILNVLDNERPMAFDSVNDKEGASIMQLYLEHIDLNNRKNYAQELKKSLKKSINVASCERDNYCRSLEGMKVYGDLDNAQKLICELEDIARKDKLVKQLKTPVQILSSLDSKLPVINEEDFAEFKLMIARCDLISKLSKHIKYVSSGEFTELKPVLKDEDFSEFKSIIDCLERVIKVKEIINNLISLTEVKIIDLTEFGNLCDILEKVSRVLTRVELNNKLLNSILPELSKSSLEEFEIYLTRLESYKRVRTVIDNLIDNLNEREKIEKEALALQNELKEFKKNNPDCPTCGQSLEGVEL